MAFVNKKKESPFVPELDGSESQTFSYVFLSQHLP